MSCQWFCPVDGLAFRLVVEVAFTFPNIGGVKECESALLRIFSRSCSGSPIAEPFQDPQETSRTSQQPRRILLSSISATTSLPAQRVQRDGARPRCALASGAVFAGFVRVVAHLPLVTFCEWLVACWMDGPHFVCPFIS